MDQHHGGDVLIDTVQTYEGIEGRQSGAQFDPHRGRGEGVLPPHSGFESCAREERVDFFHAAEQLKAALDAAYGQNDAKGRARFDKLRHVLCHDPDGAAKIVRALVSLRDKHPRRKRRREVLGYFRRHRRRMDDADAADRNLPIGSGVIGATCKTLAGQRLKRSGMRWRHAGGQAYWRCVFRVKRVASDNYPDTGGGGADTFSTGRPYMCCGHWAVGPILEWFGGTPTGSSNP